MPTNKPKLTAYVDPLIFGMVANYAEESGLSLSQAIENILNKFFFTPIDQDGLEVPRQVPHQVPHQENSISKEEVEGFIQYRIGQLADNLNDLLSDLQTRIKNLEQTSENLPPVKTESDSPKSESLSLQGSLLARRLKVNPGTLVKNREKSNFSQWTREKDPEGLAWRYNPSDQLYYSIQD